MIIVRVELLSAITGQTTELARMEIANTGHGTLARGDYRGRTLKGRSSAALSRGAVSHEGEVLNYPRQQLHVWNLVARMLAAMRYS
jgi:hypothetical protein